MKRILTLIVLIGALTGCSTTNQAVYKHGKSWTTMPAKSAMTGWTYTK